jgi:hypothetical protein
MDKLTREVLICENTRTKSYYLLINPGCNESLGEEWSELEDCGAAQAQQEGRDAKVRGGGGAVPQLPTCFKYWGNHLSFPFVFTD